MEAWDPWVNLGTMVRMERLGSQDFREYLADLGLWGHLETRVSLETRGQRDLLECLDLRDPGEILARMEYLGGLDHPDLMDLLEIGDHLAVQVPEDSRVCLGHLARMGEQARMGILESKEFLE